MQCPMSSSIGQAQGAARRSGVHLATVGKITPERAWARAKAILGSVAHGNDPAGQNSAIGGSPAS
jgi:hypothetical protein